MTLYLNLKTDKQYLQIKMGPNREKQSLKLNEIKRTTDKWPKNSQTKKRISLKQVKQPHKANTVMHGFLMPNGQRWLQCTV